MENAMDVGAFFLSNFLVLALGGGLSVVSYLAYRREKSRALALAALGFALVSVAGVLEAAYTFGVRRTYYLSGLELLRVQTVRGFVLALGLLALVYSIVRY